MSSNHDSIRIFIGYDTREPIAYHVCVQSIMETSSHPVCITPLRLSNLQTVFNRERDPKQLTDFSFTRFLVPYLCGFEGWGIFIDGDMLLREDIANLWNLKNDQDAVMVVQHDAFQGDHSFLGNSIKMFPKFNWSSVMLFNNAKCTTLTPEFLQTVAYQDLHQFKWLENESAIGALPKKWNHLVGYYEPSTDVALVHWTLGGPYFGGEFETAEFAAEWFAMRDKAFSVSN